MRNNRRTGVLAIAASLALALGTLTGGLPAAGTEGNTDAGVQEEGTLTLTTGSSDQVTFGSQSPQALATAPNSCDLVRTDERLLEFRGYLGDPAAGGTLSPGFLKDSIGVNEKIASLCYKVDAVSANNKNTPETLELKLGADLKNFAGTPMLARRASLDIELRSSGFPFYTKAQVEAKALNTGTGQSVSFNLFQAAGIAGLSPD